MNRRGYTRDSFMVKSHWKKSHYGPIIFVVRLVSGVTWPAVALWETAAYWLRSWFVECHCWLAAIYNIQHFSALDFITKDLHFVIIQNISCKLLTCFIQHTRNVQIRIYSLSCIVFVKQNRETCLIWIANVRMNIIIFW